jgi:hypothetical protein
MVNCHWSMIINENEMENLNNHHSSSRVSSVVGCLQ